jgi:DNA-directed RNA polymerase subunit N (RpoN/RPB10)
MRKKAVTPSLWHPKPQPCSSCGFRIAEPYADHRIVIENGTSATFVIDETLCKECRYTV